jgi:hypothetical protein
MHAYNLVCNEMRCCDSELVQLIEERRYLCRPLHNALLNQSLYNIGRLQWRQYSVYARSTWYVGSIYHAIAR